jgi:predicted membrane protein
MEEKKSVDRRNVAAILLIVAGGLLMLDTFDIVDFSVRHIILNWKTLLIAIGVIIVFSSEQRITGYILIGLGIVFWLPSFADYNIRLYQVFWPLVLIGVGMVILTRRNMHGRMRRLHRYSVNADGTLDNDYLDDVSIFGGGVKRYGSQNLRGGNITAIFGGSEIDLTSTKMSADGTVVDVFTMFGGTKFIIPGNWQVKSEAVSLFGGLNDKRHIKPSDDVSDKVFLIKGLVLFGGVEIKNY